MKPNFWKCTRCKAKYHAAQFAGCQVVIDEPNVCLGLVTEYKYEACDHCGDEQEIPVSHLDGVTCGKCILDSLQSNPLKVAEDLGDLDSPEKRALAFLCGAANAARQDLSTCRDANLKLIGVVEGHSSELTMLVELVQGKGSSMGLEAMERMLDDGRVPAIGELSTNIDTLSSNVMKLGGITKDLERRLDEIESVIVGDSPVDELRKRVAALEHPSLENYSKKREDVFGGLYTLFAVYRNHILEDFKGKEFQGLIDDWVTLMMQTVKEEMQKPVECTICRDGGTYDEPCPGCGKTATTTRFPSECSTCGADIVGGVPSSGLCVECTKQPRIF